MMGGASQVWAVYVQIPLIVKSQQGTIFKLFVKGQDLGRICKIKIKMDVFFLNPFLGCL